jgi:teichuronic acid exporter
MSNDLKAKGITAFTWDFTGKLASNGMGFIISIFLARLLEPSEFGLIAMIMVVIVIASVFSDSGLGVALIQRKRVLPIHYSSVFYFNIFVAVILGLLTFFSAEYIAAFYNNEELIPLAQVMSFSFILGALSSVQNIRLRKELNYALLTKITLSASLFSGGVGIVLAFNDAGVWSLVAQSLMAGIITNILLWTITSWRPSLIFSLKALKQLWAFGFNVFLTTLMEAVFSRLDILIIGKLYTPATLGFFSRAKSFNEMIISHASGSLMSVLFPVLSKIQKDLPRFQNIVIKAFGIISFVIFLLSGVVFLSAEELIIFLFSEKWLPSSGYFKVLILSGFVYAYSALLLNILISRGKSKLFLRIDIYKKMFFALNLYFGFHFGIEGYLYGFLIVSIIGHAINVYYASGEISLSAYLFIKPTLIQLVISVASGVITHLLTKEINHNNFFMLIEKSAIFIILYIAISWLFKTNSYMYSVEQFKYILNKINKKQGNMYE